MRRGPETFQILDKRCCKRRANLQKGPSFPCESHEPRDAYSLLPPACRSVTVLTRRRDPWLLLRRTMNSAQPEHQIATVDADYLSIDKALCQDS